MRHIAHAAASQDATANLNLNDEIRIPNDEVGGRGEPDGPSSSRKGRKGRRELKGRRALSGFVGPLNLKERDAALTQRTRRAQRDGHQRRVRSGEMAKPPGRFPKDSQAFPRFPKLPNTFLKNMRTGSGGRTMNTRASRPHSGPDSPCQRQALQFIRRYPG